VLLSITRLILLAADGGGYFLILFTALDHAIKFL
jgi:hypothetical protein